MEDISIPKYATWMFRENPQLFNCACDGGSREKPIDPFVYHYHMVGCKVGADAICLHDEVCSCSGCEAFQVVAHRHCRRANALICRFT